MTWCSGKIGCHECLNFLQILEIELGKVEVAIIIGDPEGIKEANEKVLSLIRSFKKGGPI